MTTNDYDTAARKAIVHDDGASGRHFTTHREPFDQGTQPYHRCVHCGRELLVSLGGFEAMTHTKRCPVARGDGRLPAASPSRGRASPQSPRGS